MQPHFVELGIKISDSLIIADPHFGKEETIANSGLLLPKTSFQQMKKTVKEMIQKTRPKRIVVNGDIKNEYAEITDSAWREVRDFARSTAGHARVFIRGNHDTFLDRIGNSLGIPVVDSIEIDGHLITHGDCLREVPKTCHTIVIGHEHPSITLQDNGRAERFKCFLVGRFREYRLIVLPSINPLSRGNDILNGHPLSPFLTDISGMRCFISTKGQILDFGKVKDIRRLQG